MKIGHRITNVLIAIDQLLLSILSLGASFPDETISSAAWRWEQQGYRLGRYLRVSIDTLFFWEDNHCLNAYIAECQRTQAPKNIEDRFLF